MAIISQYSKKQAQSQPDPVKAKLDVTAGVRTRLNTLFNQAVQVRNLNSMDIGANDDFGADAGEYQALKKAVDDLIAAFYSASDGAVLVVADVGGAAVAVK